MKRLTVSIFLCCIWTIAAFAGDGRPDTRIQAYIEEIAASEPMASAQLGVKAVGLDGTVYADWSSGSRFQPASNAKLITTGAVLNELGPEAKMETALAYSGKIEDGTLKGDLYIVGGGDPTLGTKDSIAVNLQTLFGQWKKTLESNGIHRIDGNVVGDGRWFEGQGEHPSWLYEDIGTYYGAGMDALSFYRNIQEFRVSAGPAAGTPLQVQPQYPETPWMTFTYDCSTGVAGSGDKLYLYTTDLAPVAELRGTFASDRMPKTLECSNKFGSYTLAHYFLRSLTSAGMEVSGKAAYADRKGMLRTEPGGPVLRKAAEQSALTRFASFKSPSLARIAYITNQRSDNFYAEALLRFLSKKKKGSADYKVCPTALGDAVRRLGLDPARGMNMVDGSGLSRKNSLSPAFMCSFLSAMMHSPACEAFAGSLTQPGKGSQVGRMRAEDQSCAARIYYKSGSMDGVRCYSGYVVPKDGLKEDIIVFSIMVNNFDSSLQWKVMSQIDRMMALIALEN